MRPLHIANTKKLDAEIAFGSKTERRSVRMVLPGGEEKRNVKVLKSTVDLELGKLIEQYGDMPDIAQALMDEDPEIDMEIIGRKLSHTHKLYVNQSNEIVYRVNLYRVIRNPDGTERERRDLNKLPSNVNVDIPLQWTGKFYSKTDAIRQFVFTRKYQLRHVNGVTYEFLYNMAKELQERNSLVLVGGGAKGTKPILLTRGGEPYRGFMEGRVDRESYCLILHLTNMELKGI